MKELYDDEHLERMVHAGVATRHLAEVLGQFVNQLLDEGFTQEGAEHLADSMLVAMIHE